MSSACGCGRETTIYCGHPRKFVHGHNRRGEARYVVNAETGCWEINVPRYGEVTRDGKRTGSHRHAYEQVHGPIPPGLEIDHTCRNTRCVNPAHLEAVTPTENKRRSRTTKLTLAQVEEIRRLRPTTSLRELAQRFGVSESNVSMIATGRSWTVDQNGAATADTAPRHDSLEVPR